MSVTNGDIVVVPTIERWETKETFLNILELAKRCASRNPLHLQILLQMEVEVSKGAPMRNLAHNAFFMMNSRMVVLGCIQRGDDVKIVFLGPEASRFIREGNYQRVIVVSSQEMTRLHEKYPNANFTVRKISMKHNHDDNSARTQDGKVICALQIPSSEQVIPHSLTFHGDQTLSQCEAKDYASRFYKSCNSNDRI